MILHNRRERDPLDALNSQPAPLKPDRSEKHLCPNLINTSSGFRCLCPQQSALIIGALTFDSLPLLKCLKFSWTPRRHPYLCRSQAPLALLQHNATEQGNKQRCISLLLLRRAISNALCLFNSFSCSGRSSIESMPSLLPFLLYHTLCCA